MANSKSNIASVLTLALLVLGMSLSASASRALLGDKAHNIAVVLAEIDGLLNGSSLRIDHATQIVPNATVLTDAVTAVSTLLAAANYPPTDGRTRDASEPPVPLTQQEEYDLLYQIVDCSNSTYTTITTAHGYLGDAMDELYQTVALGSRLLANYKNIPQE